MGSQLGFLKNSQIRTTLYNNERWYAVVDVVEMLTDSKSPQKYWNDLKIELYQEGYRELSENIEQLKMPSSNQKFYMTDCVNTETLFRIIQSISSAKAEIFKSWLARVANESVQEIVNPEIAIRRARSLYKAKGYSDVWIDKRFLSVVIREKLTDEWTKRDVKQGMEHHILIDEIARDSLGLTTSQHKNLKGLQRENLRDHMTNLELIFSMLGEAATNEITRVDDAQGFDDIRKSAHKGGEVACTARKDLENKTWKRVVSGDNYLTATEEQKNRLKGE